MHGLGLADHALAEALFHPKQFFLFALEHLVDRHAGPARNHLRDVIGGDRLFHHLARAVLGLGLYLGQLFLEFGNPPIGQFAGALIFAPALRVGEFDAKPIKFAFQLLRVG